MILSGGPKIAALLTFVDVMRHKKFVWGHTDCNTFALTWLDIVGNTREVQKVVGLYSSEGSAREFAFDHGGTIADVLMAAGATVVEGGKAFAQPGDFLLVEDPGEPWLRCHICTGSDFASIWPGHGFGQYPLRYLPADTVVMRLEAPCLR